MFFPRFYAHSHPRHETLRYVYCKNDLHILKTRASKLCSKTLQNMLDFEDFNFDRDGMTNKICMRIYV